MLVDARYPYREDPARWKVRPCVVRRVEASGIVVQALTTSERARARGEVLGEVLPDRRNGLTTRCFLLRGVASIPVTDVVAQRGWEAS
jgi:hypothetical protein